MDDRSFLTKNGNMLWYGGWGMAAIIIIIIVGFVWPGVLLNKSKRSGPRLSKRVDNYNAKAGDPWNSTSKAIGQERINSSYRLLENLPPSMSVRSRSLMRQKAENLYITPMDTPSKKGTISHKTNQKIAKLNSSTSTENTGLSYSLAQPNIASGGNFETPFGQNNTGIVSAGSVVRPSGSERRALDTNPLINR